MKKFFITALSVIMALFIVGCNTPATAVNNNANELNDEISRLKETIDMMTKISDLEKELAELKKNKANADTIQDLEDQISILRFFIQKLDVRTNPFPDWNSYITGFLIKDLLYFMEDYEKFANEYHNHILATAGICVKVEISDDGYEIITLKQNEAEIKIKTRYQNGESYKVLGKDTTLLFLYRVEDGFTLGYYDYYYWIFPNHYFKFVNLPTPGDANYATIKEIIDDADGQIYFEISNEHYGKTFIADNKLDEFFNSISYDAGENKITIKLENNILTQEKFVKIIETFFSMYGPTLMIIQK